MPNENGSITDNDVIVVDSLDADSLKKNLETTLAQKKHFREKFEKEVAEKATLLAKIAEYEKSSKPLPTEPKPDAPKPAAPDFDNLIDNVSAIRGLSDDEVDELRSEAKNLGVDPIRYIKSKPGQAHLKEFRTTKKTQESTPSPSSRIPTFNGKPVKDVLTDEKASPADKQKAFESLMRKSRSDNE
jgi:hypothetical protein